MTSLATSHLGHSVHRPHGWLASFALHGAVVLAAMLLLSGLRPSTQPEPFHWDIALSQLTQAEPKHAEVQPLASSPVPPKPVRQSPPSPVQPSEEQAIAQRPQVIQTVEPVHQVVRQQEAGQQQPHSIVESVASNAEPVYQNSRQVEPADAEVSAIQTPVMQTSAIQTSVKESSPIENAPAPVETSTVHTSQPMSVAPVNPIDVAVASEPQTVTSTAVERPSAVPHQPTEGSSQGEPLAPAPQIASAASVQAQPVERTAVVSQATKTDLSWLAQEIIARLEQAKRYPYLARMNRWEGKVIVRAVVRNDGQVISLQIAESSGHSVLDNDALELIKKVSPLTLKHPLGKTEVALLVPVGYSLR